MALLRSPAAKTALTDHPTLKVAADRVYIRDAISSEGKPSTEQSLVESAALKDLAGRMEAALAEQQFKPVGPDFSRLDFSLLDSAKDTQQDSTTDLLALSPESAFAGQQGISSEDAIAMLTAEDSGDFFLENFSAQPGRFDAAAEGALGGGNNAQTEGDGGHQRPAADWEAIRTNVWGLPPSEFDSDEPPPQKDNSAIAGDGKTQAGSAPIDVNVNGDGEIKGGGKGPDDEALNALSNSVTGLYSNRGAALNQALDEQDSISRNVVSTHTSSDGVVTAVKYSDGTVVVTNKNNGTTTTNNPKDNSGTTTTTNSDGSTTTTDNKTGKETSSAPPANNSNPVKQPSDDGETLTPEEKARLHDTIGKELHIQRPGEAPANGDIDYGEDGAPVEVTGPGVDMEAVKDFLIGQPVGPDGEFGGASQDRTLRAHPEAGGDFDPTKDAATNPQGTGPEDDPLDQGHEIETSPPSAAESASADEGETATINFAGFDLRLADDPGAALKNEDFDLLQQQAETAVDIVPDFDLDTLPLPGLDLGHVFGSEVFG